MSAADPQVERLFSEQPFFLSAEDLLLDQPQPSAVIRVPTLQARQNAPPSVAFLLNAFPLPNLAVGPYGDPAVTGVSQFVGSYSLQQNQQTYGLRLDHSLTDRLMLFARYNRAPSQRLDPWFQGPPSNIQRYAIETEMLTMGLTHALTLNLVNELRLNGSRQSADVSIGTREVAGAKSIPDSTIFPAGYTSRDASVTVGFLTLPSLALGLVSQDRARQLQFIDNLSYGRAAHQFKFGVDYRWFSPVELMPRASTQLTFLGLYGPGGVYNASVPVVNVAIPNESEAAYIVKAFSTYAQDTWRARKSITFTYGIRWEVDPAPRVSAGQAEVLTGLTNLNDASSALLVPFGKPFYRTTWSNFAPRLGMGWQIFNSPAGKTVLRAGAGRFFDLAQAGFEDTGAFTPMLGLRYENQQLGSIAAGPPSERTRLTRDANNVVAAAPGYTLPVTYEWNVTIEQSIRLQTFSAAYVGALGRRLIGYITSVPAAAPYPPILVLGNDASSSYHAMQFQFNRRLSGPVRLLLSYTWSHFVAKLKKKPFRLTAGGDCRSWLRGEAEQSGNKVSLADRITFCQPSHSALPDHVYRFDFPATPAKAL
jgi:TonB dependent receptor